MVSDLSVVTQHCLGGVAVGGLSAATRCRMRQRGLQGGVCGLRPPLWLLSKAVFFFNLNSLWPVALLVPPTFRGCSAVG